MSGEDLPPAIRQRMDGLAGIVQQHIVSCFEVRDRRLSKIEGDEVVRRVAMDLESRRTSVSELEQLKRIVQDNCDVGYILQRNLGWLKGDIEKILDRVISLERHNQQSQFYANSSDYSRVDLGRHPFFIAKSGYNDAGEFLETYLVQKHYQFFDREMTLHKKRRVSMLTYLNVLNARESLRKKSLTPEKNKHYRSTKDPVLRLYTSEHSERLFITDSLGELLLESVVHPDLPMKGTLLENNLVLCDRQRRFRIIQRGLPHPVAEVYNKANGQTCPIRLRPDPLGIVLYLEPQLDRLR